MLEEMPVVPIVIGKVAFAVKRKNVNNEKCFRHSHFTPDGYPDILHFTFYILHFTYYLLPIAYCKLQIANCPFKKAYIFTILIVSVCPPDMVRI